MMIFDIFLIYLACGAPFAVHFFLQERKFTDRNLLLIKTSFYLLFWFIPAYKLLSNHRSLKSITGKKNQYDYFDDGSENQILSIQKQLENIFINSYTAISIYQFREVLNRYVGLTIACRPGDQSKQIAEYENELFSLNNRKNIELSSICLKRRNQKRLIFHQNLARCDFLKIIRLLFETDIDSKKLEGIVIGFVGQLQDHVAQNHLKLMLTQPLKLELNHTVNKSEEDSWKTEITKPSTSDQISPILKTMTVTATLQTKE